MEASLLYCSVGCGRTPHAISWNRNGVLGFAADRSIALAKQERVNMRIYAIHLSLPLICNRTLLYRIF